MEESEHFESTVLYIFGKDFEKSAKRQVESMKFLLTNTGQDNSFFSMATPTATAKLNVGALLQRQLRQ